jgi:hypothetical protein
MVFLRSLRPELNNSHSLTEPGFGKAEGCRKPKDGNAGIHSPESVMPQSCPAMQIFNLRYRRIPFGRPAERSETPALAKARGLEIGDTAG